MTEDAHREIFTDLATYLHRQRDIIVAHWAIAVRKSRVIENDEHLSKPQMIDHIPGIIEQIVEELLRSPDGEEIRSGITGNAEAHGSYRWKQGYQVHELVEELALLRTVLCEQIATFEVSRLDFSGSIRTKALARVHRFLDDLVGRAVKQFVKDEQERVEQESTSRVQLFRTVSHELRNVLNAVNFAAEGMRGENTPAEREELVSMVGRNVRHMRELLDELLDLSSLAAGRKVVSITTFSPAELLKEILSSFKESAEKKELELEGRSDPRVGLITGDELKTKQIISNLVSNAIKYTPSGRVSVEFDSCDDRTWKIVVKDTGVGIPPEDQQQIFSELYRVKKTAHFQGVGLGLAIAKKLVDLMGGSIGVESASQGGTCFTVLLPRIIAPEPAL